MNHYFNNNPDSKSNKKEFNIIIGDIKYTFNTDNSVFSKNYLDYGTKLLLKSLPIKKIKGQILDLGCGYGPIGIYIAKNTKVKVHMVDINERALFLAKENSIKNDVFTKVYFSNIYDNINDRFDFIITNPPIRAGKEVVYKMLFEAKNYLKNNGELWLVVRKKQGAETIIRDLKTEYRVEIINKDKGYCIIKAILVD
ncbi:MAG: methyltransferase [Bacilli bacterium]